MDENLLVKMVAVLYNDPYVEKFVAWLADFKRLKNKVNATPHGLNLYIEEDFKNKCSNVDLEEDHAEENIQDWIERLRVIIVTA